MYKGSIYNMLYLRMEMELEDVYADIDTPDGSDEEDDTSEMEVINVFVAKKNILEQICTQCFYFRKSKCCQPVYNCHTPFPIWPP